MKHPLAMVDPEWFTDSLLCPGDSEPLISRIWFIFHEIYLKARMCLFSSVRGWYEAWWVTELTELSSSADLQRHPQRGKIRAVSWEWGFEGSILLPPGASRLLIPLWLWPVGFQGYQSWAGEGMGIGPVKGHRTFSCWNFSHFSSINTSCPLVDFQSSEKNWYWQFFGQCSYCFLEEWILGHPYSSILLKSFWDRNVENEFWVGRYCFLGSFYYYSETSWWKNQIRISSTSHPCSATALPSELLLHLSILYFPHFGVFGILALALPRPPCM